MKRATVNFILDLAGFAAFVMLTASGIVMKWGLPHGGHGFRGGRGPAEEVVCLLMNEHQWTEVHFWLGIFFIVVVLVHLVLHWDWVKCYVKSLFGGAVKQSCEENLSS